MRPQYHFRRSPQGLCAWNVRRLVELSRDLLRELVPLSAIRELDEPYWSNEGTQILTCREVVDLENRTEIEAVRFVRDPAPDYIGIDPDDLPYDE
jgi:hypothetical protein